MKKLYTVISFLLVLNAKSFSQGHIPFYGFELSNYEVGDTLEYTNSFTEGATGRNTTKIEMLNVISKKIISNDTIQYSFQQSYTYSDAGPHSYQNGIDTIQRTITNDTVYNNNNNILGVALSWQGLPTNYDTINGLKNLRNNFPLVAVQNIGIEIYSNGFDNSYTLLYVHLYHYGIYGSYQPIISGINNLPDPVTSISIRYDNGFPTIFISSSQNVAYLTITIYDLPGRVLETKPVNIGNNPLNLNNFAKGMYLYKVSSNGIAIGQGKLMNL